MTSSLLKSTLENQDPAKKDSPSTKNSKMQLAQNPQEQRRRLAFETGKMESRENHQEILFVAPSEQPEEEDLQLYLKKLARKGQTASLFEIRLVPVSN